MRLRAKNNNLDYLSTYHALGLNKAEHYVRASHSDSNRKDSHDVMLYTTDTSSPAGATVVEYYASEDGVN